MEARIAVLPGDGIGPEVTDGALAILARVGDLYGHTFQTATYPVGGRAIDESGEPLPGPTRTACLAADAVLLGAVGGPQWDDPGATVRPEQGLLAIRKAMGLFANLRPVVPHPALIDASPLKADKLTGTDILVVRELTGGIYFGAPRGRRQIDDEWEAFDTMVYRESEVRRVAHLAFTAAGRRRGKVASIDKANVLESSRLWRQTVNDVAARYPDVTLEHVLVDAATMHLLSRPASFDVILASNLFGDIVTDEASMLTGSMGNLPSASLGAALNDHGWPRGLYEPIHGSAPDIAGQGIANPIGAILSLAMLLRHSLGLEEEAHRVEKSVHDTLALGLRTIDLATPDQMTLNTKAMTEAISERLH